MKFIVIILTMTALIPLMGDEVEVRWFGATSFPNPCKDVCVIRFHNMDAVQHEITRAQMLDINGIIVDDFLTEVKYAGRVKTLDVSVSMKSRPAGVYIVATTQGGVTNVWKFLKVD